MLHESPMQSITECLNRVRCDLCKAGNLKHPTMNKFLQKGTQIFSSSLILARCLEQLKCPRDHEHIPVAGSFLKPNGQRCHVSEDTELYTKTFGLRIAKAMKASRMTSETALRCPPLMFHSHHQEDDPSDAVEQESKRRRISSKTTNPAGYPEQKMPSNNSCREDNAPDSKSPIVQLQQEILLKAFKNAPRVGKVILESGEIKMSKWLFQSIAFE